MEGNRPDPLLDAIGSSLVDIQDQSALAQSIMTTAEHELSDMLAAQESSRLSKLKSKKLKVLEKISKLEDSMTATAAKQERMDALLSTLSDIRTEEKDVRSRLEAPAAGQPLEETERQKLIRTGKITPFSGIEGSDKPKDNQNELIPNDTILESMFQSDEEEVINDDVTSLYQGENSDDDGGIWKDDGDERYYLERYNKWAIKRRQKRLRFLESQHNNADDVDALVPTNDSNLQDEAYKPLLMTPDAEFKGGFKIPADIYSHLFEYQRTCTKWLWELHEQGEPIISF